MLVCYCFIRAHGLPLLVIDSCTLLLNPPFPLWSTVTGNECYLPGQKQEANKHKTKSQPPPQQTRHFQGTLHSFEDWDYCSGCSQMVPLGPQTVCSLYLGARETLFPLHTGPDQAVSLSCHQVWLSPLPQSHLVFLSIEAFPSALLKCCSTNTELVFPRGMILAVLCFLKSRLWEQRRWFCLERLPIVRIYLE